MCLQNPLQNYILSLVVYSLQTVQFTMLHEIVYSMNATFPSPSPVQLIPLISEQNKRELKFYPYFNINWKTQSL